MTPVDQLGEVVAAYGPPTHFEGMEDGASSDDENSAPDHSVAHLDDNGDVVDLDINGEAVFRLD